MINLLEKLKQASIREVIDFPVDGGIIRVMIKPLDDIGLLVWSDIYKIKEAESLSKLQLVPDNNYPFKDGEMTVKQETIWYGKDVEQGKKDIQAPETKAHFYARYSAYRDTIIAVSHLMFYDETGEHRLIQGNDDIDYLHEAIRLNGSIIETLEDIFSRQIVQRNEAFKNVKKEESGTKKKN